jgi:hypothetical protein
VRVRRGTVLSDQDTLLRGPAVWLFKYGRSQGLTSYSTDPSYYARLKQAGVNAVRVVCFDPWQRSNKYDHYDWRNESDRAEFLADLDRVVELTAKHRMYALINYHDVGRYELAYMEQFWAMIAPRYAGQTHVFFEITNEPASWFPENYTDAVLRDQERIYGQVRAAAPETHIVLLSFANTMTFNPEHTVTSVARRLRGIDWSTASVGFHPYGTGGSSAAILELKKEFPVVNTEMNIPPAEGGDGNTTPMDGEAWGFQTMERLGISWFSWKMAGPDEFARNFEGKLLSDAQAKGYLWQPDR